ncbi:unnamed protein product [Rotaria sp. Silwood1]|nr:unnamed protein product [Rotaria sp. Silwood1]
MVQQVQEYRQEQEKASQTQDNPVKSQTVQDKVETRPDDSTVHSNDENEMTSLLIVDLPWSQPSQPNSANDDQSNISGTMQTKLIKMICKRAALMRAPYRQSSWTNNTSPTKQKLSSQSKTKSSVRTKSIESNNNKNKLVKKKAHMVDKDLKNNSGQETNTNNNIKQ